ncbi:MAG: HAMP domain-containing protein [Anaerolineales bacterium]|nr:HAMP domain-containing protein [Anaerolineales bacterium]
MRLPNLQAIRWKIALPQLGMFLSILLGLLLFLTGFVRQAYLETLTNRLEAECRLLAASVLALRQGGASVSELDALARSAGGSLGLRMTIIDSDGTVLGDSEADFAAMENHLTRPEVQQALAQGHGSSVRHSATTGIETLYVAVPMTKADSPAGYVRLAVPLAEVNAYVRNLETTLLAAMGIAVFASLILSVFAAQRTTRPLEELTEAANQVADGQLQTTLLPIGRDEIGRLTEAFNIMTRHLRLQFESLRTERGKLAAVLSQMTDGMAILDPQGKITLINPAARQMFGIAEEKALGATIVEAFRYYQLVDLWRNCRDSGKPQAATVELAPEGLLLQAVATPLGESLSGSILLLFQDLTKLRRLETVRRDFIANISHELRTPLASLQSLAETMQSGAVEDPAASGRFLGLMLSEIDTMHQTLRELLELSKIESGELPLTAKAVDPAALWNSAVRRLQTLAERNGLTLENRTPENLPPVLADSEKIEQVMMNLLHNAIKFTPAGGSIVVSTQTDEQEGTFSIRDTGVGVAEEDLPRIFERFYKADRSRSGGGTGLGLSIARHIIERHGGRIWAESEEGKGTAFFFTLPIASAS